MMIHAFTAWSLGPHGSIWSQSWFSQYLYSGIWYQLYQAAWQYDQQIYNKDIIGTMSLIWALLYAYLSANTIEHTVTYKTIAMFHTFWMGRLYLHHFWLNDHDSTTNRKLCILAFPRHVNHVIWSSGSGDIPYSLQQVHDNSFVAGPASATNVPLEQPLSHDW